MEITAPTSSYSPVQEASLRQAASAGQRQLAAKPRDEVASIRQEVASQREQMDPQQAAAREARKAAASEAASQAGFKFEYQENTRVMKVQDSKGILIYQVPSKGQIALLDAAERQPSQVETTA